MVLKFKAFAGTSNLKLPAASSVSYTRSETCQSSTSNDVNEDFKNDISAEDWERKQRSDEQRRAALREREAKWKQEKKLISNALKQVDATANKSQHKRFSDSESDTEGSVESKLKSRPKTIEKTLSKRKNDSEKDGKMSLFNDSDAEVDDNINIKPHLFGKKGAELMAREAHFNGDDRFRITEKFLEEDDDQGVISKNKKGHISTAQDDDSTGKSAHERQTEHDVMAKIFGKPQPPPTSVSGSIGASQGMVRFDPANPQHYQYDLGAIEKSKKVDESEHDGTANEPNEKKAKKEKKRKEKQAEAEKAAAAKMEQESRVDARRFHDTNPEFLESLRKKLSGSSNAEEADLKNDAGNLNISEIKSTQNENTEKQLCETSDKNNSQSATPGFSLLQTLGRTDLLPNRSSLSSQKPTDKAAVTSSLQSSELWKPVSDSGSPKNSSEPTTSKTIDSDSLPVRPTDGVNVRFFMDFESLSKEIQNFRCTQTDDEVRKHWDKYRASLTLSYKRQRKDAVRQVRQFNQMQDRFGVASGSVTKGQSSALGNKHRSIAPTIKIQPIHHPRQERKLRAKQNQQRAAPWKTWKHKQTGDQKSATPASSSGRRQRSAKEIELRQKRRSNRLQ